MIRDIFGTSNLFSGLSCVPAIPAAMTVTINAGSAYALQNIDNTVYSSLPANTTNQIVKQGILLNSVSLAMTAPATAGFSQNYLISANFVEADVNPVVLAYYNASNPTQAYSGPGNTGVAQSTTRQDTINLTLTPGVAATSGTQATPATPAGTTALWVVTVANGQTTIIAANIAQVVGAPFLTASLLAQIQASGPDTARVQGLAGKNNASTPSTQFDFSAMGVTLRNPVTGGTAVATNTGTITNNVALAGPVANGRDQAVAFAASQWIYFYFIWNPTTSTLATIASTATPAVGPALPAGYTAWAYIGTVYFNSSSALAVGYFRGSWFAYTTTLPVVANGGSTTPAAVAIPTVIPPQQFSPMFELQVLNLGVTATSGGSYSGTMSITIDNIGQSLVSGLQGGGNANVFTAISGTTKRMPNLSQGFTYQWGNLGSSTSPQTNINCGGYSVANGGE